MGNWIWIPSLPYGLEGKGREGKGKERKGKERNYPIVYFEKVELYRAFTHQLPGFFRGAWPDLRTFCGSYNSVEVLLKKIVILNALLLLKTWYS